MTVGCAGGQWIIVMYPKPPALYAPPPLFSASLDAEDPQWVIGGYTPGGPPAAPENHRRPKNLSKTMLAKRNEVVLHFYRNWVRTLHRQVRHYLSTLEKTKRAAVTAGTLAVNTPDAIATGLNKIDEACEDALVGAWNML